MNEKAMGTKSAGASPGDGGVQNVGPGKRGRAGKQVDVHTDPTDTAIESSSL